MTLNWSLNTERPKQEHCHDVRIVVTSVKLFVTEKSLLVNKKALLLNAGEKAFQGSRVHSAYKKSN